MLWNRQIRIENLTSRRKALTRGSWSLRIWSVIKNDTILELILRHMSSLSYKTLGNGWIGNRRECMLTGRTRSKYRITGMSRIKSRELISEGYFLGIKKSSW